MTETDIATATRPARVRKSAPTKKVEAEANLEVQDTNTRTYITLDPYPGATVKSYARFRAPEGSGCGGTFYAPLGTVEVRVCIVRPAK